MSNDLLIIRGEQNLSQKISDFYKNLDASPKELKSFVKNPIGSIMSEVLPGALDNTTAAKISESNKFLFVALKNEKFIKWASSYQADLEKN